MYVAQGLQFCPDNYWIKEDGRSPNHPFITKKFCFEHIEMRAMKNIFLGQNSKCAALLEHKNYTLFRDIKSEMW